MPYNDFPTKFWYNKQSKKWAKRHKENQQGVGRLYSVSPGEGERFYLHLLLTCTPGATCFADLRTTGGVVHATYKAAAAARGLLKDDRAADECLAEAAASQMPSALRTLFVMLLVWEQPQHPLALWEKHREALCEDILRDARAQNPDAELDEGVLNRGLYALQQQLHHFQYALEDFGRQAASSCPSTPCASPPPTTWRPTRRTRSCCGWRTCW